SSDVCSSDLRIRHWVPRINLHLLKPENLAFNRAAQNAVIVRIFWAEVRCGQGPEPPLKRLEPGQLCIERSLAEVGDLAIVLMQAKRSPGLGPPGQKTGEILVRHFGESRVA